VARITAYLVENIRPALASRPQKLDRTDWFAIIGYFSLAAVLGLTGGLFQLGWPSLQDVIILPPLLVFYPALLEGVIFRGLLLPRSLTNRPKAIRMLALGLSTLIFVAWHPFNHYFISLSDTSLFIKPSFLAIVAALGLVCGHLYLKTRSLWPSVMVHWATGVVWTLFLGRPGN